MNSEPTDADIEAALRAGTPERWRALWEAFDDLLTEPEPGTWAGGEQVDTTVVDGEEHPVIQMPYVIYADSVQRVVQALYALDAVVPFNWPHWDGIARLREPYALATASVADAVRMATAIIRGDRFTEGALAGAIDDGTFPAALERLRAWRAAEVHTAAETDTIRDRAVGALLGLAAGDAVGTTLEFKRPGSFNPITDMVGGGPFGLAAGAWTDDTSMALCLAESLLDTGGMDLSDQLRRYVLWRDHGYLSSTGLCFDIGGTTTTQLDRFKRTGEAIDPDLNEDAAANGSLMRLAPVAIRWHADVAVAAERAAESSRSTHPATRPVDACRLLGAMTAAFINGATTDEVWSPDFWRWGPLHPEIQAIAAGSWRTKKPPQIRGTGYCVDALEAAIWAVAGASDFAGAVLRAANLGDDADTTAAIAGQIAGARWGASGIPKAWGDKLVLHERIFELATRLHSAGSPDSGPPARWPHDETLHAWWVEPGSVLAGEYPAAKHDQRRTAEKCNLLVDAGIRTFIDLTTPEDRLRPYAPLVEKIAAARGLHLRHINIGIPDLGVLPDGDYDPILDLIDEHRARGGVYVHCWGGVGRTGTIVGGLLARHGHDFDSILDKLKDLRSGTKKARRPCPETDVQLDVLRRCSAR